MKPVSLRPKAEADLIERTQHYANEGGRALGERFFDAAMQALNEVSEMPGLGSPRAGELTGIDGLRRLPVPGFPCGWYYLELTQSVDVVRLLADRQDLGARLEDG